MRIVSNTSPIWNLANIDRLDLLHSQFSEVIIPTEVEKELHLESDYPEVEKIKYAIDSEWIKGIAYIAHPWMEGICLKIKG